MTRKVVGKENQLVGLFTMTLPLRDNLDNQLSTTHLNDYVTTTHSTNLLLSIRRAIASFSIARSANTACLQETSKLSTLPFL